MGAYPGREGRGARTAGAMAQSCSGVRPTGGAGRNALVTSIPRVTIRAWPMVGEGRLDRRPPHSSDAGAVSIAFMVGTLATGLASWGTGDAFWARASASIVSNGVVMGASRRRLRLHRFRNHRAREN